AMIVESDQLIRTFNAILMISRLEAGYSAEAMSKVALGAAVRDVAELYEPAAEEAGVDLAAGIDGSFIIDGNCELIGQRLSITVDNAVESSFGSTDTPRGRVLLEGGGREVRLSVPDKGPGIPDENDRQRATERFVPLEKSRSLP